MLSPNYSMLLKYASQSVYSYQVSPLTKGNNITNRVCM